MLLNGGASLDLRDNIDRTSLHWAASGGHTTVCSTLIHQGLLVDVVDQGGYVLYGGGGGGVMYGGRSVVWR